MAAKSPLARVKDEFGGKDKLVDKIVGLLGSDDEPKDEKRRRLLGAANSQLLRLHRKASAIKEAGGRDQLAAVAAQEMGHGKDKDYVTKLGDYPPGRLLDMIDTARRRNRRSAAGGAAPAAEPAANATAKAKGEGKAAAQA